MTKYENEDQKGVGVGNNSLEGVAAEAELMPLNETITRVSTAKTLILLHSKPQVLREVMIQRRRNKRERGVEP